MSVRREISHSRHDALVVSDPPTDNPTVAEHYQQLIAAGWTQNAIATASQVSKRQLRYIEHGVPVIDHVATAVLAVDPTSLGDDLRLTDPGPAAEHVRQLLAQGASGSRIADVANVSHSNISSLRNGRHRAITVGVERRILAIHIDQVRSQRPNAGRPPGVGVSLTDGPGPWADHGACRAHPDTDLWFPVSRGAGRNGHDTAYLRIVARAKAICATCPVLDDCRAYIDANPQPGIWAGTTERDRKDARRRGAA